MFGVDNCIVWGFSFEERGKSLTTIIRNHKTRTTFETFTANVFSPVLPPSTFQTGHTNRASGTILQLPQFIFEKFYPKSNRPFDLDHLGTSFTSSTRTTASTVTANSAQSQQLSTALQLESSIPAAPLRNKVPFHDATFSPPGKQTNHSRSVSPDIK